MILLKVNGQKVMIEIYKKNNYLKQVTYQDGSGQIVDLTNFEVKIILKRENDVSNVDTYAVLNKTYNINDGTDGSFLIELTQEDTDLPAGLYNFEVQLTKDPIRATVHQSKLKILETFIKE